MGTSGGSRGALPRCCCCTSSAAIDVEEMSSSTALPSATSGFHLTLTYPKLPLRNELTRFCTLCSPAMLSCFFPQNNRKLHYWAKSTLFKPGFARTILLDAGNIPVDRRTKVRHLSQISVAREILTLAIICSSRSPGQPKALRINIRHAQVRRVCRRLPGRGKLHHARVGTGIERWSKLGRVGVC